MTTFLQSSLLSPFSVKARVLCGAFDVETTYTPEDGNPLLVARLQLHMEAAARGFGRCLHRNPSALEEFPLVPWLFPEGGGYLCDSTEIGLYLERIHSKRLTPTNPARAFAARLVEEAVDEVGLYALHHMRWVYSARTNRAMDVLRDEIRGSLGGVAARLFVRRFGPRQVRRLQYLFSVAPQNDRRFEDIPGALRPPAREGFPPTHELLEQIWRRLVSALDEVLADGREYVFGAGLTLADAALLGNLGSTQQVDPEAAAELEPRVSAWLEDRLERGELGEHDLDADPLVIWAAECALPLLRANAAAYATRPLEAGGPRNEAAYYAGVGLFEGELLGHPYRTVVKDFQVKTHFELQQMFRELPVADQVRFQSLGVTFAA